MSKVKVSFKPSIKQLAFIKEWLIEEENLYQEGFYCNWGSIEDSFSQNNLAIIILNGSPIGFVTWYEYERVTEIRITEIKVGYRGQGYGRILIESLYTRLLKKGIAVLQLHCQPSKSIKAWKRLGFKEYPDVKDFGSFNSANDKYLYKILVPYDKPRKFSNATESIELWSVDPYMSNRHAPAWAWKPKFKKDSRKLALPVIFPAKPDWNICWKINNNVVKEEKVKRFGKKDIDFSNFIIIEELPLSQPSRKHDGVKGPSDDQNLHQLNV